MDQSPADGFPFSEYALRLEKTFDHLSGRVKYRAKNAFQHIRGAWVIRQIDQGMSAFRAITAEEEAATAVILALKAKKYPGSERLEHYKHDHKMAVFGLIQVISRIFSRVDYTPQLYLVDGERPPRIRLQFDINRLAGITDAEPLFAEPIYPLDFSLGNSRGAKVLSEEFEEFAGEKGFAKTIGFLKSEANVRNRILYASDTGIPLVKIQDEFIQHRKDRVVTMLTIALMIEQTDEHQSFVVQCLRTLLTTLTRLEAEVGSQLVEPPPATERPIVQITKTPESSKIEVLRNGSSQTAQFEYRASLQFTVRWLPQWYVSL